MRGSCSCGAIGYVLTHRPLFTHACHCTWCQRETGGPHAINALIESDRIRIDRGRPVEVPVASASGRGQIIIRCPNCQVALWSHYDGSGRDIAFVRVGTLNDPGAFPPDIHIFTSTRLPWYVLPPGVPAVPEFYDRTRYWPADSLKRREAVLARDGGQ